MALGWVWWRAWLPWFGAWCKICFCRTIRCEHLWTEFRCNSPSGVTLEQNLVSPAHAPPSFPGTLSEFQVHEKHYTHRNTPKGPERRGWNEMKWEFVFPPAGFLASPSCRSKTIRAGTRIGVPMLFQLISVASLARIGNQSPCLLLCWYTDSKRTIKTHGLPVWRCTKRRIQTHV